MDRITKEHRSWNMSRIRGKNTKPEMIIRRYLYSNGIRYRLHTKLPGRPDVAITKKKAAIFVNGCFWHAHEGCANFRIPKTRPEFWSQKLAGNKQRDEKNYDALRAIGWRVFVIWECDIKRDYDERLRELLDAVLMDNQHSG